MPYNVGLKVQYPEGTNLANINVTLRNERTNDSETKTTNSGGEAVFGLEDINKFPGGFSTGDVFSWAIAYQGFQGFGSHTSTSGEGGYIATIVLTAVPTAPTLKYFTAQQFLDYFNLKIFEDDAENGLKLNHLVLMGESVESDIDGDTNTVFDDNSGSYYTQSEYIDTNKYDDVYHLTKRPVNSITNLYTTQNDEETTPDYTNNTTEWDSLTENTDFFVDTDTGRVMVTNGSYVPISRKRGLYAVYTYGRSTAPADIRQLAILETGLRMGLISVLKAKVFDKNASSDDFMNWFERYRRRVINKYKFRGIHNT